MRRVQMNISQIYAINMWQVKEFLWATSDEHHQFFFIFQIYDGPKSATVQISVKSVLTLVQLMLAFIDNLISPNCH